MGNLYLAIVGVEIIGKRKHGDSCLSELGNLLVKKLGEQRRAAESSGELTRLISNQKIQHNIT